MMQNMKEQPVPYSVSEKVACSQKPPNPVQILKYGFGSMEHVVNYESTFIGYELLSLSWSASWACENPLLTQVWIQRSWQKCESSTSQRDEDYDENESEAIENESKSEKKVKQQSEIPFIQPSVQAVLLAGVQIKQSSWQE